MTDVDADLVERAATRARLWPDLEAICALGGRFAGTDSEARARAFLSDRLTEISGRAPELHSFNYDGWTRGDASLEVEGSGKKLECVSLVRSPATDSNGLAAELIDLGRGAEEDFQRHAARIPGRIVLVRHEYMFAADTIHRRRKYDWAVAAGAAGFLIAGFHPGRMPVTGSSGARPGHGIPAAGISAETTAEIIAAGCPRVTLHIAATERPADTENLILDLPGKGREWVVLCAHLDGHHLAESAMDNGSGMAGVLAVAEALAPRCREFERGLRIIFFSAEEWALTGSRLYVDSLSEADRDAIALVVNLDTIAGSARLTALTSGFPALTGFVTRVAEETELAIGTHQPLMANSDHYNFAQAGIPALRLVAGFDDPQSNIQYLLTPGDRLDKIDPRDLANGTRVAAALCLAACTAPELNLRS